MLKLEVGFGISVKAVKVWVLGLTMKALGVGVRYVSFLWNVAVILILVILLFSTLHPPHLTDSCIYKAFTATTTDWFFQKDPPSIEMSILKKIGFICLERERERETKLEFLHIIKYKL